MSKEGLIAGSMVRQEQWEQAAPVDLVIVAPVDFLPQVGFEPPAPAEVVAEAEGLSTQAGRSLHRNRPFPGSAIGTWYARERS